ncbi:Sensor histidine kinase [Rickettsiales bacterium Ac37b]|nr:Sensor histidine kinase [Rickettsiales bacterium Ac37b]
MQKAINLAFWIKALANIAENRVKKYGASYYTFSIVGLINFPIAIIYEIYTKSYLTGIIIRIISLILCLVLLFHKQWPYKLKFYLPLYWFSVIIFTLPFLTTYLLLKNNFSLEWLINFNIGVMIVILLLDSITFLSVEAIGIILGLLFFYVLGNKIDSWPTGYQTYLFFYMFLCITILGTIFAKNKEIFNHFKEKTLNEVNEYLETQVQSRTAELEHALSAKTEFLNNMSHEIRTPTQGFTNLSEGLVEHWNILEDQRKFDLAKQVATNAKRLSSLLNHLLDLSKFQAGKMIMKLEKIDLNLIILKMIEEAKILYMAEKEVLINYTPLKDAFILADKERIGQVLRNLFVNSIKFSPNNSTLTVSLSSSEITYDDENKCEAYHFAIKDEGIGIPENELYTIFEVFVQSSKTKTKAGGTGLGLAYVKKLSKLIMVKFGQKIMNKVQLLTLLFQYRRPNKWTAIILLPKIMSKYLQNLPLKLLNQLTF